MDAGRGEVIGDYDKYAEKWLTRCAKESEFPIPDLVLPCPTNVTIFSNAKQRDAHLLNDKLVKGEKWINNRTRLHVSDTSKHEYPVPFSSHTENNLKRRLPGEASSPDLDLAQSLLHSNLAKSTRKVMSSIERTLTSLVPERDIFQNPHPGDKELLLLRLVQHKPGMSYKSQIKYANTYNSILLDRGITPPPESPIFKRLKTGLENRQHNPRKAAEVPRRQAHTRETILLLSHALGQMGPRKHGLWDELRVQAVFTSALIAFWACARLSDLCGADATGYSVRTTLLEKDCSLIFEDNKVIGLELFFGSEKVPQALGSRVQLPKIPPGPMENLCPVRAYIRYQKLKMKLSPQPDAPWLIDSDGKPISHRSLTRLMDLAVEKSFSSTNLIHYLRKLRGHSFRSALPTCMQAMSSEFTKEEKLMMGRWFTDQAYALYCKDKVRNRLSVAQAVAKHLELS